MMMILSYSDIFIKYDRCACIRYKYLRVSINALFIAICEAGGFKKGSTAEEAR